MKPNLTKVQAAISVAAVTGLFVLFTFTFFQSTYASGEASRASQSNTSNSDAGGTGSDSIVFNSNLTYGTMTDVDGNTYKTIVIGTQTWMAENLKTTRYSDGTAIPLVTDGAAWAGLSTPAYCWFNNDRDTFGPTYGTMYNWYTVNTGKLCPVGWHVPTDAEWTTLTNYLGGTSVAGGKLKEAGTRHWLKPNAGATNSSGFTGLPGGIRWHIDGGYYAPGYSGIYWSSTEGSTNTSWILYLWYPGSILYRLGFYKKNGIYVRCLRD